MYTLKAFTLMELLVGMVISSIVIAFGYSTYAIIYKQYLSYKSVKTTVVETMQLHTTMSNDFNNAECITFGENKLKLSGPDKLLMYNFIDSLVIRSEKEMSDTFQLAANDIQTTSVFNHGINNDTLINSLQFNISVFDNKEHFTFTKKYSAHILMNYEMQGQEQK